MAPPSIYGDPKINHDADTGSVNLEVMVTGAIPDKTQWFFGDKELAASDTYAFHTSDAGGNRKLLRLEIKDFDKPLAGEYKAKFFSNDGENSASFTVQAGSESNTVLLPLSDAPEFHDKPHIVQRDNGNVIVIKDDKPVKMSDRVKAVVKADDKDKAGFQFLLEITGPAKTDEGKYKCVVKNAEGQNQQSLNLCFD